MQTGPVLHGNEQELGQRRMRGGQRSWSSTSQHPGRKGRRAVGTGGSRGTLSPGHPGPPELNHSPHRVPRGAAGCPSPAPAQGAAVAQGKGLWEGGGGGHFSASSSGCLCEHRCGRTARGLCVVPEARPPLRGHRLCPAPRQLCPGTASSLSSSATRSRAPSLCTAAASLALLDCRCSFIAYFGSRAG